MQAATFLNRPGSFLLLMLSFSLDLQRYSGRKLLQFQTTFCFPNSNPSTILLFKFLSFLNTYQERVLKLLFGFTLPVLFFYFSFCHGGLLQTRSWVGFRFAHFLPSLGERVSKASIFIFRQLKFRLVQVHTLRIRDFASHIKSSTTRILFIYLSSPEKKIHGQHRGWLQQLRKLSLLYPRWVLLRKKNFSSCKLGHAPLPNYVSFPLRPWWKSKCLHCLASSSAFQGLLPGRKSQRA